MNELLISVLIGESKARTNDFSSINIADRLGKIY